MIVRFVFIFNVIDNQLLKYYLQILDKLRMRWFRILTSHSIETIEFSNSKVLI